MSEVMPNNPNIASRLALVAALVGSGGCVPDIIESASVGTSGTQSSGSETGNEETSTGTSSTESGTSETETGTGTEETGGPECGDGMVEGDEQCDLGNENTDDLACDEYDLDPMTLEGCNTACEIVEVDCPSCGDGVVNGPETCEDGNIIDTDACTNTCQEATCGDNIVWEGQEACDGTATPTCEELGFAGGDSSCAEECDRVLVDGCYN